MRRRYLDRFAARGVDPGRVALAGWSPIGGMLAASRRVDIALNPFPYSGGLRTCEALWMGVPVVARPGGTFAGRHALSFVTNTGLSGTVAPDLTRYVEIAVGLGADRPRLAAIRSEPRPRMARSPLCDGPRLAGHLLHALRVRWRKWCTSSSR